MTSSLPRTTEEILRTGEIDPEFADAIKDMPSQENIVWNIHDIKDGYTAALPARQSTLAASRPDELTESEHYITLRDGYQSRIILCHRTSTPASGKAPLMVLLFGGGGCVGSPEQELETARDLALALNLIVVLPSYRLAPENPFPCGHNDCWDTLQWAAADSINHSILPPFTDAGQGFLIGGTSSGAILSGSLAHVARDRNLNPPLTGQALFATSCIAEGHEPAKYKPRLLSRKQNANSPILTKQLVSLFNAALNPDYNSPLFSFFNQHHPDDLDGEVAKGHMGICPVYFQICGMDTARDDALVYESVLREECKIATRVDLYPGLPHCWWSMFGHLKSAVKRRKDTVEGVRWLLNP